MSTVVYWAAPLADLGRAGDSGRGASRTSRMRRCESQKIGGVAHNDDTPPGPGLRSDGHLRDLRQAPGFEVDVSPIDTEQRSYFFQFAACTHMPQRLLMLSCCFVEEG